MGSPEISGGTYVIYEHATRLQGLGHDVTIITENPVKETQYAWHSSAGNLRWLTLEQAGKEHFDIAIATWWQSPFLLKDLESTHSVYFVQSIETRFFESVDSIDYGTQDHDIWQKLCEKTYSFALPMITEALWIKEYLHDNYNVNPFLVRNGIRKDIYTPTGSVISPVEEGKLRVLIEGPVDVAYKNVPASIQLARQADVDEIWLLTSSDVSEYPGVDRVFSKIPIHETPEIYRSCDVLLKLSYVEGMFGPPLEIFHCGGTAIIYDVTGHDEYIVHNRNSYVVQKDNKKDVVRYLSLLKNDHHALAKLKAGARKTAEEWPDWQVCSFEFEKALTSIAQQHETSREYLKRYTKELLDMAIPLTKEKVLDRFSKREKQVAKSKATEKHNFVELYWHCEDNFKSDNFKWVYYRCEEWTAISFEVDVSGFPFWLRIDPSTRVGFVEFESVVVVNQDTQQEIMSFQDPDDFTVLFLCGSAYWIDHERKNIIFSFGSDPAVVLPAVDKDKASLGDRLKIEIKLKETGIQQFFREYYVNCQEEQSVLPEQAPSCSWKRKLVNKLIR